MFLPVLWLRHGSCSMKLKMSSSKFGQTYLYIPQILSVWGVFPFWVRQIVCRMLENLRCLFLTEGIALLIRCFYRNFPPQETFGEYSSAAAMFSLLGMHSTWGIDLALYYPFPFAMSLVSIKWTKHILMISFLFFKTRVPHVTSLSTRNFKAE